MTQTATPGESVTDLALFFILSGELVLSFIYAESRACIPLKPFDIFQRRLIALADLIMFLTYAANAALVFSLTLFLQEVRGFVPIETGLIVIPGEHGGITGATFVPG